MSFTVDSKCALCGTHTKEVLSLTATPPANALEDAEAQVHPATYPLDLRLCPECGHLQLGVTVDPEILYRAYTYISPKGMLGHWRLHCAQMVPRFGLKLQDLVVEIGSNSGDLLSFYRDAGMRVLGFEPAQKIADAANARNVTTLPYFFGAEFVRRSHIEKAKLVLANNIFAHVADLKDFVEGVKTILAPDGVFIFEVHWRVTLVGTDDWTSIYHEHLCYWALKTTIDFFEVHGMRVFDVQAIPTHNGSMRVFVQRAGGPHERNNAALDTWCAEEERLALFDELTYTSLHVRINRACTEFKNIFEGLTWGPINAGGVKPVVAVLGCPAKLTTLAYHLGLRSNDVDYVCDDEPLKQGKLTPGKRWPIVPFEALVKNPPGVCILAVYNYEEAILNRVRSICRDAGIPTPVIIVPFPTVRMVKL